MDSINSDNNYNKFNKSFNHYFSNCYRNAKDQIVNVYNHLNDDDGNEETEQLILLLGIIYISIF